MARSFGAQAGAYERGRPDYPREAVEWMLQPTGLGTSAAPRVADVGAGTGKLTRVVAGVLRDAGGGDVIAVEPDADMLEALRAAVPGVETLIGTAEAMPLPDESLDAAVFGQSWHWVEPVAGSREIGRVLKPGGVIGLIWNIRDESVDWVARLSAIMHNSAAEQFLSSQFADGQVAGGQFDEGAQPLLHAPFGPAESRSWPWTRSMTRAALYDMVRSRSYVITAEPDERARIESELAALFDEIGAVDEASIDLPYVTTAFRAVRTDASE